jgi:hypothetical protein
VPEAGLQSVPEAGLQSVPEAGVQPLPEAGVPEAGLQPGEAGMPRPVRNELLVAVLLPAQV